MDGVVDAEMEKRRNNSHHYRGQTQREIMKAIFIVNDAGD
jgi:hypothetical protein